MTCFKLSDDHRSDPPLCIHLLVPEATLGPTESKSAGLGGRGGEIVVGTSWSMASEEGEGNQWDKNSLVRRRAGVYKGAHVHMFI